MELSIISKKTSGSIFLLGLFLILVIHIVSFAPIQIALAEMILLTFSVLFLYRLDWGLLLFLLMRPSIDRQAEYLSVGVNDFSFNIAAIVGALLVLFFILYLFKYFKLFLKTPLKLSWLLFLMVLFFGIFYSINQMASVYECIRITSLFAVFALVFVAVKNGLGVRRVLYTILFSSVIPFLFAIYQIITGTGLGSTPGVESRIYGTFSHPSPFALYILTIVAISFFIITTEKKFSWAHVFFAISVIMLLGTFTRGAWIALIVFLSIIGIMKYPKMLLGIVFISLVLFFSSTIIHDRIEDIYNPPADSSIRWRFGQWENMFNAAQDRIVVGYGTGTEAIVHYHELGPDAGNPYTHNDFLKVTVENGLLGLATFLILVFSTMFLLFKRFKAENISQLKDFSLIILSLFAVFMMVSFGDNVLRSTATQWSLWSLIALSLANKKQYKTK